MSHTIFISVGSNIDRVHHTRQGLNAMYELFGPLILSNVYESEAVGFDGKPFYNLVVGANTSLCVDEVCKQLKCIESANGRLRGDKKFAPRTLDLDLLLYDHLVTTEGVVLPRDEIAYNAFVLLPLSELAPTYMHPVLNQTIAELWEQYDKPEQKLWMIDFEWSEPNR